MPAAETFVFQAEINQLLSLIINAFYSNKDIFLRELISNASDALDKIRYASLTDAEALGASRTLEIKITPDAKANTLTIEDTGVGMTREEIIKNLGTIAHSGTRAFVEGIQAQDLSLIGQFGVGFYSAFLVADRVQVVSRSRDDPTPHIWESTASGSFTVSSYEDDDAPERGTRITLFLKEDQTQYATEASIKDIVLKHSQFCMFPIKLWVEKEVAKPVDGDADAPTPPDTDAPTDAKPVGADAPTDEGTIDVEEPVRPAAAPVMEWRWEVINTQPPIWTRKPAEVTHEEYVEFYKAVYNSTDAPLAYKHVVVDGAVQFKAILYIPRTAPMAIYGRDTERPRNNVKLFVKHVLILDETNFLLPEYFNFVFGIVDSDDLPLNISREMLQQNSVLQVIKKNMMKQCIEMMTDLSKTKPDDWRKFYETYGRSIKQGVYDDVKHRPKLLDLMRFHTSKRMDVSFKQYVDDMREDQKDIYFLAGDSLKTIGTSPILQKLKHMEVLLLTDPIDEYCMEAIKFYEDKRIVNTARDGFELPKTDTEREALEAQRKDWEPVCEKMREILPFAKGVYKVRVGEGMADVPCVLVSDMFSMTANMEKIFRAQTINSLFTQSTNSRKLMEVNPEHPLIREIRRRVEADEPIKDIVGVLFDTASLMSGYNIEDPTEYSKKVFRMLSTGVAPEPTPDADGEIDPAVLLNEMD